MKTFALALALFFSLGASFSETDASRLKELEELHRTADDLILQARFRDVVRLCEEMIFLEPDDEWAYEKMGAAYMVLGDHPRAKEAFLNTLDINPRNETAMRALKNIADPDAVLTP